MNRSARLVLATCLGLFAAAIPSFAHARPILSTVVNSTGVEPHAIAMADLNGDSRPDIVTTSKSGSTIEIMFQEPGGHPGSPVSVPVSAGTGLRGVAAADLDGDGIRDLAVTNPSANMVEVLMGLGGGAFAGGVSYPTGAEPRSVLAGDINGDGRIDLVTINYMGNSVTVLTRTAGGSYVPASYSSGGFHPISGTLGRIDGDALLDIAVGHSDVEVGILLGSALGTQVRVNAWSPQNAVGIRDLNHDGFADLITANASQGKVRVLLGTGPAAFADPVEYATPNPTDLVLPDLDADGNSDVVTLYQPGGSGGPPPIGSVSIRFGVGNGTFGAARTLSLQGTPVSAAAGDYDGNGRADVAFTDNTNSTVNVFLSAAGRLVGRRDVSQTLASYGVRLADMNADGHLDIVDAGSYCFMTCGGGGSLGVCLGDGTGSFGGRMGIGIYDPDYYVVDAAGPIDVADFNGDGKLDVVMAPSRRARIAIFLGNGNGTFAQNIDSHVGEGFSAPAAGDFDEDGFADLVSGNGTLYRGLGNAQFDNAGAVGGAAPFLIRDFDEDGNLDLVYSGAGQILVRLGNGDLTFDPPVPYANPSGTSAIVSEDFDGDGNFDVVQRVSSGVGFLKGNGDGTFAASLVSSTGASTGPLLGLDLEGNGSFDVANSGGDPFNVRVTNGEGDGTFSGLSTASTAVASAQMATGDLNHDGATDVVVSCWNNNTGNPGNAVLSVLLAMQSDPVTAVAPRLETGSVALAIRPNPSRTRATIDFVLPTAGHAVVEVLDLAGRRVAELHRGSLEAGAHSMTWSGPRTANPGVYFARLTAAGRQATKRLVWLP